MSRQRGNNKRLRIDLPRGEKIRLLSRDEIDEAKVDVLSTLEDAINRDQGTTLEWSETSEIVQKVCKQIKQMDYSIRLNRYGNKNFVTLPATKRQKAKNVEKKKFRDDGSAGSSEKVASSVSGGSASMSSGAQPAGQPSSVQESLNESSGVGGQETGYDSDVGESFDSVEKSQNLMSSTME